MIALGDAPPALSEAQLLETLKSDVEKIIRDDIPADTEPERIFALRQAQKADFYWRAIQNVSPKWTESGMIAYSAIGAPISNTKGKDTYVYDYCINIFRGYGRKFVAVLGQRLPNVKAVPDDPDDEDALRRTRMADIAANVLRSQWDMEMRHMELALQLYKTATAFIYTPWVTDAEKYGKRSEPKIESRTVKNGPDTWKCAACGQVYPDQQSSLQDPHQGMIQHTPAPTVDVPQVVGMAQYDNGRVEYHMCNIFTVTVPFWSKDLDDAPWLSYEYDEYKGKLIRMFPDLRDEVTDSPGTYDSASSQLAKLVRDAAASPLGVPNPHRDSRWTYRRLWLKTFMYELIKEDDKRQLIQQYFPDGLKVTMVNGKVKKLENEKLTDVWVACKPETSEYIYADGIGYDMLPVQDLKNDGMNLAYRTFEGGIGINFCDPRAIDPDQWEFRQRVPNEIVGVLPSYGGSLQEAFYQVPPAEMSQQFMPWLASLEQDGRVAIGTTEAVYGGMIQGQETAHEAELRKNAALQQLGVTYMFIRKADEKVYQNGVKQLARFASGTLKASKKSDTGYDSLVLDISQLSEDGWHFESEEAFPMTHAERRAYLMWILGTPAMAQALGVSHPRNIGKNQAALGLTDYYADGVDDHYKSQEIIQELIKGQPIRNPQPDGSSDTQPSIPIDDFDDHALMAQEAFAWCKSTSGRREQKDNSAGFANVVAWGLAHMKASNPPPAPLPPPKLAISAKLGDLQPQQAQAVFGDFNVQVPPPLGAPEPIGGPPSPGPPSGGLQKPQNGLPVPPAGANPPPPPAAGQGGATPPAPPSNAIAPGLPVQ